MNKKPSVLLTGGAGYIGSHTFVALSQAGYAPVIIDDFSNSNPAVLQRLETLTGEPVVCEKGDVNDTAFVADVIARHGCSSAVHLAGFKAVGESVEQPLMYFRNNVGSLVSLLEAMRQHPFCRAVVFSSSATVYGEPTQVPISEACACEPESPYASTKLMCEQVLAALPASDPRWRVGVLRYFNPVGAHASGLIGEDPSGIPNNLMPYVSQVAVGKRDRLRVFGNDYATPDGTGVRDYLHVCDLADGHVAAVRVLLQAPATHKGLTSGRALSPVMQPGGFTVNLGTGQGTSVLGVLQAFERASGRRIPFEFAPRRAGDVAAYFADASLAREVLGWRAQRSMDDMCRDAWNWQQKNPQGYQTALPDGAATDSKAAKSVVNSPLKRGGQEKPAGRPREVSSAW